jgi:polyphosphate kinase
MCGLRPGLPGASENIRVRSIVGRFLEHSRVFYFRNDDDPVVLCASADLMERNLYRRVEVCFPILDKKHRERVIADLKSFLRDDKQAWDLDSAGGWKRATPAKDAPGYSVQADLLAHLAEGG